MIFFWSILPSCQNLSLHRKWKNKKNKNVQTVFYTFRKDVRSWKCKILILLIVLDFDIFGPLFFKFKIWYLWCSVFVIWEIKTSWNLSTEEGILSYVVTKPKPAPEVYGLFFDVDFSVFLTWCPKFNISFVRHTNLHIGSKWCLFTEKKDHHFSWHLRWIAWVGLVEKKTMDHLFYRCKDYPKWLDQNLCSQFFWKMTMFWAFSSPLTRLDDLLKDCYGAIYQETIMPPPFHTVEKFWRGFGHSKWCKCSCHDV